MTILAALATRALSYRGFLGQATTIAFGVVVVELASHRFIRNRWMDAPILSGGLPGGP